MATQKKELMPAVRAIALGILVVLIIHFSSSPLTTAAFEDVTLMIIPSAERAYTYGTKHFDARRVDDYDIRRAERLFRRALEHDASYPFVQHQLARIAFLRGDNMTALARINAELARDPNLASYYVRALIYGFMGEHDKAIADYETFLREESMNWAAINDYAWVLLKSDRAGDALLAADWGLMHTPENAWLLNSKASAHVALGQFELAYEAALAASAAMGKVTPIDWLNAYPGNDPLSAGAGLEALRVAIRENIHTVGLARAEVEKSVR